MPASFIIRKATNGQFHFNLTAANNKNILSSETYRDKSGAQAGIASVRANCAADSNYDRRTSSGGHAYFVLMAANKEVIGRSEMYSSKSSMERGIASVKRNGARPSSATKPDQHSNPNRAALCSTHPQATCAAAQ
jgi:uncharacterized protein YegP (UPF0339 family)